MALILHFVRVPRYENLRTKEYETIPFKDLQVINDYYDWKRLRSEGETDCNSLKDWCGVWEDDMPHKYIVNYYGDFYDTKMAYNDYDGELVETYSIFEDIARLVKMNQIFNWLINNVTDGKIDHEFHEISEEKMKKFYRALRNIRRHATLDDDGFHVNEEDAKENIPVMDNPPVFWGTSEYNELYAEQVVKTHEVVRDIIQTTDFKKESIYFVASW